MLLRRLVRWPSLALRRLRWTMGSWSKASDRQYHDSLYDAQDHDAFTSEYPGYVTIRRFADHVEPLIPAAGTVLDVGCGPGEITCELARRHPHLSFAGIDHSERAIDRARRNAARLNLTNIRFMTGDAERLPPEDRYGLVTMFDAFHHLERPHDFLNWLRSRTSRCVLIEPAGTWTGRWQRSLDVDWLLFDLASIRERLEAACGDTAIADATPFGEVAGAGVDARAAGAHTSLRRGEGAVERRYALDDFERFFSGWHLRVTGTIAGFDRYPPRPHARSALRPIAGAIAYELVRATEELLLRHDRDGAAKHWVIAATTEKGVLEPRLPKASSIGEAPLRLPPRRVKSGFDVRYLNYEGPSRVTAGASFQASIDLVNAGWDEWRSDGEHPVHVSYHWLASDGVMREFDGLRTGLARPIAAGETYRVTIRVKAPAEPADYRLAVDLVKEGITWFSEAGMSWYVVKVTVTGR